MACATAAPSRKRGKSKVKSFTEITVGPMLGIKGGAKRDATLVDIIEHEGRSCVAIHKKARWLMQHAFGSAQYVIKDSQFQALNHVLENLYEAASDGGSRSLDEPLAGGTDGGCSPAFDGSPVRAKLASTSSDAPLPAKTRRLRKLGVGLSDPDPPSPVKTPKKKHKTFPEKT